MATKKCWSSRPPSFWHTDSDPFIGLSRVQIMTVFRFGSGRGPTEFFVRPPNIFDNFCSPSPISLSFLFSSPFFYKLQRGIFVVFYALFGKFLVQRKVVIGSSTQVLSRPRSGSKSKCHESACNTQGRRSGWSWLGSGSNPREKISIRIQPLRKTRSGYDPR